MPTFSFVALFRFCGHILGGRCQKIRVKTGCFSDLCFKIIKARSYFLKKLLNRHVDVVAGYLKAAVLVLTC